MNDFLLKLSDEEAVQLYIALSHYLKLNADKYLPIKYKIQTKEYTLDEFNLLELKLEELRQHLDKYELLPTMDYVC